MKLHKIVYFFLISFILSNEAYAIPAQAELNIQSPLFSQFVHLRNIYLGSCLKSNSGGTLIQEMPMFENDSLVNTFREAYPEVTNFNVHMLVYAGFELGRALNLTDLSADYSNNICQRYAMNFASTMVNDAAMTKGSSTYTPPPPSGAASDFPNPFNDFLAPKEKVTVKLTARIAEQSACVYMYTVFAKHPVIEVNAMDATLDMMQDMLFKNYKRDDIRNQYLNLLTGSKMGRLLFVAKQDVRLCYD